MNFQEIPLNLCNPNIHYRIHKYPPPVRILGQINPVYTSTSQFLKNNRNITLPSAPEFPKWSLSIVSSPKSCIRLSNRPLSTCSAHLFLYDLITRTILGEHYRSFCYVVFSTPLFLVFLRLNIPSTPYFQPHSSLNLRDQVPHTHTKKRECWCF